MIRFVKPSKIPFCYPFNFFVRLKTPTTQPCLEVGEQIIVAGVQVWRIRWVRKRLKTLFMFLCLCNVRCVRWCIVITKKDFFLIQMCPFLPDFVNTGHIFPSRSSTEVWTTIFHNVKHVEFCAKKGVFSGNFTALFYSKISAPTSHRILVDTYGDHALSTKYAKIGLDPPKLIILMY